MRPRKSRLFTAAISSLRAAVFIGAALSLPGPALFVDGALPGMPPSPTVRTQEGASDLVRLVGEIPGWVRTGEPRTFARETLYGYIDGGAEIVLQYGFRRLVVIEFRSKSKEIFLEIYEMESGEAAFGLYSTKVEGGEDRSERIAAAHWISPGQANFVKGPYLVNILAPDSTVEEIEEIAAALEPRVPGRATERPSGVGWLPPEGLVPGSERYIKGEPAALGESPLLEKGFWGFGPRGTVAYSAKYSPFPSRVAIVDFGAEIGDFEDLVLELFHEYLSDVRKSGAGVVEGRSPVGHWFLFAQDKRTGRYAALVLGEPDEATARTRLKEALERVPLK